MTTVGGVKPEIRKQMQAVVNASEDGWEQAWQKKLTLWDQGVSSPALVNLCKEPGLVPEGRALVPGCGGGYDCFLFASSGNRTAVGVDLAPSGVALAEQNRDKLGISEDKVKFICGDFFKFDLEDRFDVVFDYTFLCALSPSLRKPWAARMSEAIKPGGVLICLMFPLASYEGGPPYALNVDLYHELLDETFECMFVRDCESFAPRQGQEKISMWKRK
ncbi:thiopurine S-methyltransferase [Synchytrium microbalum]|uniref:Thiopurine S-methyltransferase n=1 Tax=Synchytrium microbalum TaxID=1806994 RepID=A0A507C3N4_9FUNG|nr:thiopurine S-methyltransferase [Synchytrium microbalum]TPX33679.1 thiopurine S-methyltransferase [Synchytrium microbalum]